LFEVIGGDLCFFNALKLATHIFGFVLNIELIEAPLKEPGMQPVCLSVWRLDIQ
jgi:hypothetical protein